MTPQLEKDNHQVTQAVADADTLIVSTVLKYASDGKSVSVFANDTDILIMLVFHWQDKMADINVLSTVQSQGKKQSKVFNVKEASGMLDDTTKYLLLFIHAFGGCDTTSAIYDKGKQAVKRLVDRSPEARDLTKVFMNDKADKETIGKTGIALFVLLNGGKTGDYLTSFRYASYMKMATSSSRIIPKLPPTERAAHFHSLRAYFR